MMQESSLVGRHLGSYQILELLGVGGMGEVYRAHDARLGRDVAVKILPRALAVEPERLARFEREARTLAALNHPNIAAIYGLEDADGVPVLVLELVDGETLADRLRRGALPINECLNLARQIAEAIEAAHERHIVHRDLKPANINVTAEGRVKVLDFGLAKALAGDAAAFDLSELPTISAAATREGAIVGTPAYMSPEQARGHSVDRRADLWAFGVVLYEMLTGRRAFTGESVSDTLAHVLTKEPDWTALPADTPTSVRTLLRRCLAKDRKRRLDSAIAARLELDDVSNPSHQEQPASAAPPARRVALIAMAASVAGAALAGLVIWIMARPAAPPAARTGRFALPPPPVLLEGQGGGYGGIALTPDGQHLVYSALVNADILMVRRINELEPRAIAGINRATVPFISPDGKWIGFFSPGEIRKVALAGGPPDTICATGTGDGRGATWGDDNSIVFATDDHASGLWRVSAEGGNPVAITTPDPATPEADHWFPSILPGGRGVLFTIAAKEMDNAQVAVLDLQTRQYRKLTPGRNPMYVAPSSQANGVGAKEFGYLVYASAGALRAAPFDLAKLELAGDPVTVVESVQRPSIQYAVSQSGTLVYVSPLKSVTRSLVWVDRRGNETPVPGAPPRPYGMVNLSNDGTRVALTIGVAEGAGIWILDPARPTMTLFASGGYLPVWTFNDRRILFASNRLGKSHAFAQAADGTGSVEQLTSSALNIDQWPNAVTKDGNILLVEGDDVRGYDISLFLLPARTRRPLVESRFFELAAAISPDERFFAYQSDETGRNQVYVRSFSDPNARWTITTSGGQNPVWVRSGELFYRDPSSAVVSVRTDTSGSAFSHSAPSPVVKSGYVTSMLQSFDVSPDGQRFLMMRESGERAAPPDMVVVLNWFEELKAKMASSR